MPQFGLAASTVRADKQPEGHNRFDFDRLGTSPTCADGVFGAMWAGESQRHVSKAADRHMTSHGAQGAQSTTWDDARASSTPTVGWFVRRSALWMGTLILAIVLACSLYGLASQVGANDAHVPKAPSPEFKV
jgi:hypothetical protein